VSSNTAAAIRIKIPTIGKKNEKMIAISFDRFSLIFVIKSKTCVFIL
jgi:hypothetical protein